MFWARRVARPSICSSGVCLVLRRLSPVTSARIPPRVTTGIDLRLWEEASLKMLDDLKYNLTHAYVVHIFVNVTAKTIVDKNPLSLAVTSI
jgi:hypothetical protein